VNNKPSLNPDLPAPHSRCSKQFAIGQYLSVGGSSCLASKIDGSGLAIPGKTAPVIFDGGVRLHHKDHKESWAVATSLLEAVLGLQMRQEWFSLPILRWRCEMPAQDPCAITH
jgi:hypothetical protein